MTETSLKDKTAKGLFWGGLSNGVQQLLNLSFGIFLARLLTPADYGMVGMLTVFSLIAGSLQESGFISALINKKDIKDEDYNAVFWFSILTSLLLYMILFFCAPFIAKFFHQPDLIPLARYSFLGFVIAGTGTAHSAYLYKNLMVKQRSILNITAQIISGIVGVTLAYKGFSYWGIATQSITYVSAVMIGYWFISPWRPTLRISFSPLKEMIIFSYKMLLTNIFNHLNNNIFSIVLGESYSEKEVGSYNQANKWNYMGYSLISGMIHGVAQPILTQVNNDQERQLRVFRKMIRFTAFVSFPAMLGLALIAPQLITIAITTKWWKSVQILQLLCISGAFIPITNLYSNLLISKGKSNIYMWNVIILGLSLLFAIYIVHPYGIQTMILTYISINICWLLVWHYYVNMEIHYKFIHLIMDILPFLLIAFVVMVTTYYITKPINNIYLLFFCKIILAGLMYIIIMWLSGSQTFKECLSYLQKKQM